MNDPRGVALLTVTQNPNDFVDRVRPMLNSTPFVSLTQKPEFTMLGRTYSIGYEPDLAERSCSTARGAPFSTGLDVGGLVSTAAERPFRAAANTKSSASSWRSTARSACRSAPADLAHDIRLACHGLDKNDNDFVVGLIGKELFPLSAVVQTMRKTQQTALYLERLGPFFVGRAVWQSAA